MKVHKVKKKMSIRIGHRGVLSLAGTVEDIATLIASDVKVFELEGLQQKVEMEFLTGKCLVTGNSNCFATIIFQHRVGEKPKSVRKMLEYLKGRLKLVIKKANKEFLAKADCRFVKTSGHSKK